MHHLKSRSWMLFAFCFLAGMSTNLVAKNLSSPSDISDSQPDSDKAFWVYHIEGKVQLTCPNQEPIFLEFGDQIPTLCQVHMDRNAQIIFRKASGELCVVGPHRTDTVYNGASLLILFERQPAVGLLQSVLNFMGDHLRLPVKSKGKIAEYHLQQRGGVSRGGCALPLMQIPGYGSALAPGRERFSWRPVEGVTEYLVEIYAINPVDRSLRSLFNQVIADTAVWIHLPPSPEDDTMPMGYRWLVKPVAETDQPCYYYPFTVHPREELDNRLSAIMCKSQEKTSFSERLIERAMALEQAGMLHEARRDYESLVEIQPGGNSSDLMTLFLLRSGMWSSSMVE